MRAFEVDEQLTVLDGGGLLLSRTPIECELYTLALARMPCAFLAEPQFGRMRRPGVLWVDSGAYRDLVETVRTEMLAGDGYARALLARFEESAASVACALDDVAAGRDALQELWDGLGTLMGFIAVNWLLPHEQIRTAVAEATGYSPERVEAWFAAVATSSRGSHFIEFRKELLALARRQLSGGDLDARTFALRWGKCQTSGLAAAPLEDPDAVRSEAERVAGELGSLAALDRERARLEDAAAEARARRTTALHDARRHAVARGRDARRLDDLAALLQFAVDEEEERHVLQLRATTLFRLAAEERGVLLEECSAASLGLTLGLPTQCRCAAA